MNHAPDGTCTSHDYQSIMLLISHGHVPNHTWSIITFPCHSTSSWRSLEMEWSGTRLLLEHVGCTDLPVPCSHL